MESTQSLLGLILLTALAWLFSEDRRQADLRLIATGLGLQLLLALLLLKLPLFKTLFLSLNHAILALQTATEAGTSFVFGYLGGADLPFSESTPGSSFILAFKALPLILVMSALSALLFYWRLLPLLVRGFSWLLQRSLNIGGALGLGAAANIFVGMVEAPLLVRPYLNQMTRSELFSLMTLGMATIAGTVMVLYAAILGPVLPDAMGHILTAFDHLRPRRDHGGTADGAGDRRKHRRSTGTATAGGEQHGRRYQRHHSTACTVLGPSSHLPCWWCWVAPGQPWLNQIPQPAALER